jgi:hypothetical protein
MIECKTVQIEAMCLNFLIQMFQCKVYYKYNVDIKISAHDAFLEQPPSGTLKI